MLLDAIELDDVRTVQQFNITDRDSLYECVMIAAGKGSIRCLDYLFERILEEGYDPPEFAEIAEEGVHSLPVVRYVFEKALDFFDRSEVGYDYWSSVIRLAKRSGSNDVAEWLELKF